MFQLFKHLHVHGEGGDGAGAASGEAAPAAEASGVTAPVAGEQKQENRRLTHAERRAEFQRKLDAEKVEQARQAQQSPQQPQEQPQQQKPAEKLYTQEEMEKAITGRVKNLKDSSAENAELKAKIERQNRLLAQMAKRQYGIDPGEDGSANLEAIEKEEGKTRVEEYAMENGVSEDFAAQQIRREDELKEKDRIIRELQAAEEIRKRDQLRAQMFEEHRKQADAMREEIPNFDLIQEMEANPTFTKLLASGFPVQTAYYAVHHRELMAAGQQAAATYAQRALASSIQAGASMPVEGGLGRAPAASPERAVDVKSSWRELKQRHQRGEKVYL